MNSQTKEKLIRDYHQLDWHEVLKQIQTFATSGSGKMAISSLSALATPEDAMASVSAIFDASEIIQGGVRPFFESLDLFEPWHSRIKRNAVLKTIEMKDVRSFCLEVIALQEALRLSPKPWCQAQINELMEATEPLSAIDQIITPRGEIRSDASETLYRLTREKENLTRQIQSILDKLVNDHQMSSYLQDKYVTTREGRWVLPVKSGHQHSVSGVIHGSSQTKQTVFMEPEAVLPVNNRLRQVEVEIEEEIERLLTQLSQYLATLSNEFQKTRNLLEVADCIFAKSQFSMMIAASDFVFSNEEFYLVDLKHPLLQMTAKKPVANTVGLNSKKSVLLLSGPNAGGKTVLLKSMGLAAQMARCGLPICASDGSKIPFFRDIQIGIGDSQSVGAELSTFAAHLKVLEDASKMRGHQHLILIDEICGSTDPEEGAALARSFIEKFADSDVFAVITSHLGPLKTGWSPEGKVLNGSLEYDSQTGYPTYQYLPGIPGDSLAIQTAKRIGISPEIISRAVEFLSPATRKRLAGLEEIENLKKDIILLQGHLKEETNKTKKEKEKYEKLIFEFEAEKNKHLSKIIKESEQKIEDLIAKTKVEQTFKRHTSLEEAKSQLPEVIKHRPGSPEQQTPETPESFSEKYPPGSKVFVAALHQDGIVQSRPNARGEIQILSQSMRLTVMWNELKAPHAAPNPTASLVRKSSGIAVPLADSERTIDLRGMTVDEALSELELQMDQASQSHEDRIKIIHGHGTEALKRAVRTYLSRSIYVKKWKAGAPEQGGDGMTWVEIGEG